MNETTPIPATGSGTDPVRHAVTIATRRLRQRRTLRLAATGLLGGALVSFFIAALLNFNVIQETSLPGYGGFLFLPALGGLLIGSAMGVAGKYDPVSVARLLERRLDLKDRLSTTLGATGNDPLWQAQHADAMRNAPTDADVTRAIPLTPVPRRVYIAAAISLAVLLTYFAPELPVFWNPARRAEQVAVRKEGDRLLKIAKAAEAEAKKQNLPEAEKAAQKVEKLGDEMARGRMRLKEALVQRAKLNEELRKTQDKIALDQMKRKEQETQKKLTATGRDLEKNLSNNKSEPGTDTSSPTSDTRLKSLMDALAKGDKRAVAQALREMADAADQGDPKGAEARAKMSRQLDALGDALNKNDLKDAGSSVQNGSNSLKQNDLPNTAQNLREAADRLEKNADAQDRANQNQNNQSPSGGSSHSQTPQPQREQSRMDKLQNAINNMTGQGQQGGQQGSSQSGQQSQGQQSSGSQSQGGQKSGQSGQNSGGQKSGSQGGQQGQSGQQGNNSQGKSGAQGQNGQSGQNGKQGGNNGQSGQGQGNNGKGKNGKQGGSSNGAGDGSTGSAKNGTNGGRIGRDAKEENVHTKRSGDGPETVVTEDDHDKSALPASSLPYYNEFVKKRSAPASESAQGGENVPSAYKNQVRGYFDGLPKDTRPDAKGQ